MVGAAQGNDTDGSIGVAYAVDDLVDRVVATDRDDGSMAGRDGRTCHPGDFSRTRAFSPFTADSQRLEPPFDLVLERLVVAFARGRIDDVIVHGSLLPKRRPHRLC